MPDSPAPESRSLLTVSQFAQKHPAFTEGGLRYHIFHADKNGFNQCIRRIGRKVLLDEQAVFRWVDSQPPTQGA